VNRRFRLAAVERLRETRLEEATRALAAARRAAAAAATARDAIAAELGAAVPAPRATPATATAAGTRRELLRDRLTEAGEAAAAAAQEAQHALAAWQLARADLRIVQTLHARHRAALAAAEARRDQRALDDLAGRAAVHRAGIEEGR
jgi:flagellar biosynthesis chaperone FliJ